MVNAQLPHDSKHSLLFYPDNAFSRLLIDQTHMDTFHGGTQLTLGTLRLQYWIVDGRVAVKRRLKSATGVGHFRKKGAIN